MKPLFEKWRNIIENYRKCLKFCDLSCSIKQLFEGTSNFKNRCIVEYSHKTTLKIIVFNKNNNKKKYIYFNFRVFKLYISFMSRSFTTVIGSHLSTPGTTSLYWKIFFHPSRISWHVYEGWRHSPSHLYIVYQSRGHSGMQNEYYVLLIYTRTYINSALILKTFL